MANMDSIDQNISSSEYQNIELMKKSMDQNNKMMVGFSEY